MRVSFIFQEHYLIADSIVVLQKKNEEALQKLESSKQEIVNKLHGVYMNMYELLRHKYAVPEHVQTLINSNVQPSERYLHLLKNAILDIVNRSD